MSFWRARAGTGAPQAVLIPQGRTTTLGAKIIAPTLEPWEQVEFAAPPRPRKPSPPALDEQAPEYEVEVAHDDPRLEWAAVAARGDETTFVALCREQNIRAPWWNGWSAFDAMRGIGVRPVVQDRQFIRAYLRWCVEQRRVELERVSHCHESIRAWYQHKLTRSEDDLKLYEDRSNPKPEPKDTP